MIEKAKAAKSVEELLEIAKANNVEMTADEAATYFAQLNPKSGELDDDDLDAVAGGGCNDNKTFKDGYIETTGDTFRPCFVCRSCGIARLYLDSSRYTCAGVGAGYMMAYQPRHCAQCNARAYCYNCAYYEDRNGESWCNNPNRGIAVIRP